jgi:hypothetical protein
MEWILVIAIRHSIFYFMKKGKWELLFIIYNVLYVIASCNDHPGLVISTFGLAEIISCMPDWPDLGSITFKCNRLHYNYFAIFMITVTLRLHQFSNVID